jgi:hypothetical protein
MRAVSLSAMLLFAWRQSRLCRLCAWLAAWLPLGNALGACTQEVSLGRLAGSGGSDDGGNEANSIDTFPLEDPSVCEPGVVTAYAVTPTFDLYSFNVQTLTPTLVGHIDCQEATTSPPVALAVDRLGRGWVVVDAVASGGAHELHFWKVNTKTARCGEKIAIAGYAPGTIDGISFVDNPQSAEETLFVAEKPEQGSTLHNLGTANESTGSVSQPLGSLTPDGVSSRVLLAGTSSLFALELPATPTVDGTNTVVLTRRDTTNGVVLGDKTLIAIDSAIPVGFASAYGAFWMFLVPTGSPRVKTPSLGRYAPGDASLYIQVADLGFTPAAASVPACATEDVPKSSPLHF